MAGEDDARGRADALFAYDPDELYEDAPCGYVATLPDGTIVRANRTFLGWMGYAPDELRGSLFQKRRVLMADWTAFATGRKGPRLSVVQPEAEEPRA